MLFRTFFFLIILAFSSSSYCQWWVDGGNVIWPYGNVSITNGNLNVSGSITSGVKKYVALLSQLGTDAPTATVMENSIGNIVWSRFEAGFYRATLSGAFTTAKTFVQVSSIDRMDFSPPSTFTHNLFTVTLKSIGNNDVDIVVFDTSGDMVDPGVLNSIPIEIFVYPE